jgi:hypothetical protein
MFCAPGIKKHIAGSCFDRPALIRIINNYNRKYPAKPIQNIESKTEYELWTMIRDNLANQCGDDEICWVNQDFLKSDDKVQKYYKPIKPQGQTQWLSTSDINDVLKQYENLYSDFAFMGTVPIDFDAIIEEYTKIDFCALYNGKGLKLSHENAYVGRKVRRFGFVFNLDPHDKSGSHWVSMFLDLTAVIPYIGYFDSYGSCPPPKQIIALMDRLKTQAHQCLGIELVKYCNTMRHQYKNTECGVYSLYFVEHCLDGKSFEQITENMIVDGDQAISQFVDKIQTEKKNNKKFISDEEVNQWRDRYFRPNRTMV